MKQKVNVRVTEDISTSVNRWLSIKTSKYNARSAYISAGESYRPVYASWRRTLPKTVEKLTLYQVDEIIEGGASPPFMRFFDEELPGLHVYPPLMFAQAGLALLGLGMNGHVAFHEPGVPHSFEFGDVLLKEDTATNLGLYAPVHARTFGIGAFLKTKAVLLLVTGEHKLPTFEGFLAGDTALPATALRRHDDLTVITDIQTTAGREEK